jgi:nudix-type nucleoside diphosphatase (YffH/AdpP family)
VRKTAILVRQFRPPVLIAAGEQDLLEAIAGLIEKKDSDPADAGRREAHEEAGLCLRNLDFVADAYAMPGLSTERMSLFLAVYTATDRKSEGGGTEGEHENILVEEILLTRLAELADSGKLTDMKALALAQTLRLRRPDLFTP